MPLDYASMMNTSTPSSAPAAEPAGEAEETPATGESKFGAEPETDEAQDDQNSALGGEDEPSEEEQTAADLADEAEYLVDGEKVKGSELKKGRLRQEDYTRKTQALAEERKAMVAERDEAVEARDEMLDWVKQFQDPQRAMFQLRRNFPETFEAMREAIIEQALEDQELDPKTLEYKRKAEQAEIERLGREEDEAYQRKRTEKTEKFKKTAELAVTFNGWIASSMTDAGLDPASDKHQKLVRGYIRTEYGKENWTERHFQEAAKAVAEAMGIKPDPKKEAAKKLPTVKPTGQKAPAAGGVARKPKKVEKKDTSNFFENLRRSNGLA